MPTDHPAVHEGHLQWLHMLKPLPLMLLSVHDVGSEATAVFAGNAEVLQTLVASSAWSRR